MYAKVLFKNIVLYILKYVARAQSKALSRDFLANRPNPDKPEPNGLENKEIDHEGTKTCFRAFMIVFQDFCRGKYGFWN